MQPSLVAVHILVPLCAVVCCTVRADRSVSPIPPDFEATFYGGSVAPWGESTYVRVDASGACACVVRDRAAAPMAPARIDTSFSVHPDAVESLWTAVQTSRFFELPTDWRDDRIRDGTRQSIEIVANGRSHVVGALNVHVEAFEPLLNVVDPLLPDGCSIPRIAP